MASTQIPLTKGQWTQITTTDKTGSIRHHSGKTTVIYTESVSTPAALSPTTPTMETTTMGEEFIYWGVAAADLVWAWAVEVDAVIVVSPEGS
jgi:hypothetical protein